MSDPTEELSRGAGADPPAEATQVTWTELACRCLAIAMTISVLSWAGLPLARSWFPHPGFWRLPGQTLVLAGLATAVYASAALLLGRIVELTERVRRRR